VSTPDTNLSSADTPASATGPVSAAAHQSVMQTMIVLIRREFWEHRALWMAPLVIAVLLVACAVPIHIGPMHITAEQGFWSNDSNRLALFGLTQWGLTLPQYLVMAIVLNFYLLDCLYVERKDRSILFWKSMPVSDAATVASKLLTALVVVPLGVYLLTVVTNLLFSAIWVARLSFGAGGVSLWDTVVWLKVEALMLYGVIVSMFWYAPLAAYLVLVSAWARRSVFLWATLPPVFAILVERLAFGTHYVTGLIEYRTVGIWHSVGLEHSIEHTMTQGHNHIVSLAGVFDTVNVSGPVLNIDLWLGLAVAAGFAFAAARIRRYRDDT
jgi:ABC-2 type transport system permease protein